MRTLFTPWRFTYISVSDKQAGCFLCRAAEDPSDPDRLVVHAGAHHLVMLNRYPYANGHLMVAPFAHVSDPLECAVETASEFWPLVLQCQRVLRRAYDPDGFNMGINIGQAAGAGVPEHFHFHVVPRWRGDTNFMTVLGEVRLVPEEPSQVMARLIPLFADQEV